MNCLAVQLKNIKGIPLDLKFDCLPGKVLALVGPSGSGKTTLLRCISGLYQTDKGLIKCGDHVWFDSDQKIFLPPQQRHVGIVFQNYALFPHLTVRKNIELGMQTKNLAAMRDILITVNLQGLEERIPATLSGGQQQRVALARALVREPRVLLLDEPFSAVDQVTRRKLRLELLTLIRNLSIPIILVTHDLDEATMLADQICVIHNGTGLQTGAPDDVLRTPKSALIARLMDIRNLFEGRIITQDKTTDTSLIEWAGIRFEATFQRSFSHGSMITWCIPADRVLLHRRVKPSRGIRENPVSGHISELVTVGGVSNVIITPESDHTVKLHMDLPPHVVERNQLRAGERISMSLLKNAIHLMDYSHSSSR